MLGELSTITVFQTYALAAQTLSRETHPTNENCQRKGDYGVTTTNKKIKKLKN